MKREENAVAAAVIALGLGVALGCQILGGPLPPALPEAGAAPVNGAVEQDAFAEYQQLSDPLLVLVNGQVPLPEDWAFTPFLVDDQVVDSRMREDLSALLAAAEEENVWLWTASGYRSAARQQALLDHAVRENREAGMEAGQALEDALRTVALPGHSEHQTGLALDFNDVSGDFALTEAYRWLQEHGAEYGFIQRYPAGKESVTGIAEESWHYRYVGRSHAQAMKRLGLCLEEYVLYVKAGGEG